MHSLTHSTGEEEDEEEEEEEEEEAEAVRKPRRRERLLPEFNCAEERRIPAAAVDATRTETVAVPLRTSC